MSRDTVGDAFFSRLLIEKLYCHSDAKIDVVTSDYHVKRTSEIFLHVFSSSSLIDVKGSESKSIDLGRKNREEQSLKAFRETFRNSKPGDLITIHSQLCLSHPYYNGTIHPKIDTLESIKKSLERGNWLNEHIATLAIPKRSATSTRSIQRYFDRVQRHNWPWILQSQSDRLYNFIWLPSHYQTICPWYVSTVCHQLAH